MAIAERAQHIVPESGLELAKPHKDYTVLGELDFLKDITSEFKKSKSENGIKSMIVEAGHAPGIVLNAMEEASLRGVQCKIIKDSHSHKVGSKASSVQILLNTRRFTHLEQSGVKITETNHPKGTLTKIPKLGKYSGRDHRKIYYSDKVAWLGGINLENTNFNDIDFMVRIEKPEVVEALKSIFNASYEPLMDYEVQPDKETKIVVDVGNPGESKIRNEAIKMVNEAENYIQVFSMLLPDGKMLQALKRARKRGVKVEVLTSKTKDHGVLLSKIVQTASRARYEDLHMKDLPIREAERFVHAKYIGVDGKVAMFGSHNLSWQGVFLGTEEIAMTTTNPELVRDLEAFFEKQLTSING